MLSERKRSPRCLQALAIQVDRFIARKSKMATKIIMGFRDGLRNDDVCFFVWIYEMEQFKLKVGRSGGRCFALISNQWGIGFVCYWLQPFLLSERSLSFNNVMITQSRARWTARIAELASG